MRNMPVALVTGADQGIGFQIARDLHANNFVVLVGSRDFARGEAAAAQVGPNAVAVQLDPESPGRISSSAMWPARCIRERWSYPFQGIGRSTRTPGKARPRSSGVQPTR